jgi:hemerythrin
MPLIEWNNTFSVGVSKIDEQHQEFVSLLNELHDSVQREKAGEVISHVLTELQRYVIDHFKTEESWMKLYNFPDIASHKREHLEASQRVSFFVLEHERGQKTVVVDLLKFMTDFFLNHILTVDRNYMPYFRGKI